MKNRMKVVIIFLGIGLSVSGCAKVLMGNTEGITLSGDEFAQSDIYSKAEKHCQAYGKSAILTLKEYDIHTFECR